MQLSQIPNVTASVDEPNLVGPAGLVPVMLLARRAGLDTLAARRVRIPGGAGFDAAAKVCSIVAGMVTGADSIDDMDVLREGAVGKVLPGVKAPSTLGTFLRSFTFGHVRQLGAVADGLLAGLARLVPALTGQSAHRDAGWWLDVDDTMRQTHGYAKQGVGYGYNKVKGLNALLATCSTPDTAPVIVGQRLRRGGVNSARGAGKFIADAVAAARRAGATATIRVRADSAYYNAQVVAAIRAGGAQFSVTARMDPAVRKAIAAIDEDRWTSIQYPQAIWDEDERRWISDAQVAETTYTAFTSKAGGKVTARLIVRRVKRLNPAAPAGQQELFATWRYHAVFTDTSEAMLTAEAHHRDHAIVEQVIADLKDSALAHLPSGKFTANAAWLACAVMAYNLSRAAGVLGGGKLPRARTGTIRDRLIKIPARLSRTARTYTLHLPANTRHGARFLIMFTAAKDPPAAA
jgi:hypothetical protein